MMQFHKLVTRGLIIHCGVVYACAVWMQNIVILAWEHFTLTSQRSKWPHKVEAGKSHAQIDRVWAAPLNMPTQRDVDSKCLTGVCLLSITAFLAAGDSTVSKYQIDLDLILENLKDLNVLAGEGVSQIEHIAGGARLRQPESVSLTFYQNGIVMFNGPFRSYEEPSTQQCLQDIMDGYFPSELQKRYPDGVPFQVTDRRDVFFRERQLPENFPGQGQVVGHSRSSEVKETSEIPGPKLSLEQFLNKLPKSLIREGQVLDIRGPIKETLQGSDGTRSNEVILVGTPSLAAMKERLKADEQDQPPAPNISTLRIKSENGEQTYIVKMLFTETIGDLRRHLAQSRGGEPQPYEIISTFPQRVYADNSMTLQECGLIPNASLLLREKIPSAKEGQGHR